LDSNSNSLIERRDYLIDQFRVSFLGGAVWQCACHEFVGARACRHTREAAGMREAQSQIERQVSSGASKLTKPGRRMR
jgi:hypothetical protein